MTIAHALIAHLGQQDPQFVEHLRGALLCGLPGWRTPGDDTIPGTQQDRRAGCDGTGRSADGHGAERVAVVTLGHVYVERSLLAFVEASPGGGHLMPASTADRPSPTKNTRDSGFGDRATSSSASRIPGSWVKRGMSNGPASAPAGRSPR